ncbi:MAG: hypothetical protein U5R31_08875 [Acidimicrobiia bacterium]|nr:hypothetical protein [Acidimicrobiia bacterium]
MPRTARTVAERHRAAGFEGCWVFALGTTDAANVAVGSNVGYRERIDRMMAVAGDDPVLWVDTRTVVPSGSWSDANMQGWNQALAEAAAAYDNLHVYEWSRVAQGPWFAGDGIHYTPAGAAERARRIADTLAGLWGGP